MTISASGGGGGCSRVTITGGGGPTPFLFFVHGHQIFAKCTCTKMYKNVQNRFFHVWKFPG